MVGLLPRAVIRQGWGLRLLDALVTPHGIDRFIELVDPMWTVRTLRAKVTSVHRVTANTVQLRLQPSPQWPGFEAGQFIRIAVEIDGVLRSRCYSPSNAVGAELEITVKKHAEGKVSQYLWSYAEPGLILDISEAEGEFKLPSPLPPSLLLVSAGSGITPVLSMLRTLCARGYDGEIGFLHYAPSPADVAAKDEIDDLARKHDNVRVRYGFTREPQPGEFDGYFDPAHLDAVASDPATPTFLCGPATLMDRVRAHYEEQGLSEHLFTEDFTPPVIEANPDEASGVLRFSESDKSVDNSGDTLLAQAENIGLSPEYGCRMGICYSCTKIKRSGQTRNALTGAMSAEENEEIQLCISVPVGDVVVEA